MSEVVTVLKEFQGQRPLPLVRQVPSAETFPIEALGEVLGSAALAIHDHVQSPLAMCGQAVLAAATWLFKATPMSSWQPDKSSRSRISI